MMSLEALHLWFEKGKRKSWQIALSDVLFHRKNPQIFVGHQ